MEKQNKKTERFVCKNAIGEIAVNGEIVYSTIKDRVGCDVSNEIGAVSVNDSIRWTKIYPIYIQYNNDKSLVEIWDGNQTGVLLDNGEAHHMEIGLISNSWCYEGIIVQGLFYEEAMEILDKKVKNESNVSYNNKNLMQRDETEYKIGIDYANNDTVDAMAFCLYEKENKFFDDRKFPFWLKVISGHERPIGTIFYVKDELTRYRKEDVELYTGYVPSFTENDLIDKLRGTKEKSKEKDYILEDDKQNNNGGASDWYSLPKNANTLQDLIEHRNMNGSVKDIFKACYRLGIKTEDELRDLNKMAYYSLREIGRISNRKDYIQIARELIGSQSEEETK